MDLRQRACGLVGRHPALAHVSTLLTGTVLAQVVVLVTTPVIGRLYSPAEVGSFASMLAIAQMVGTIAALRYDMAIVLPERDDEARRLLRLALAVAALVCGLAALICILAAERIAVWLHHPGIAPYLGWTGILALATATVNSCAYWLTRTTDYRGIARNRVHQTLAIEGTRIALPFAGLSGILGQLGSQLVGTILSALLLASRARSGLRRPGTGGSPTRELARRYRRMPLLNLPNALVDAVRINGITLLIGVYFSADPQGQFAKAWLLMQAPVALVTSAVSQVFYQRFARATRGGLLPLVTRSIVFSLAAGVPAFLLLLIIAPSVFPWYLGAEWGLSGLIARALVPWLLLTVVTSPISTVFIVTDRQALMLCFSLVYAAAPLALISWLGASGASIVSTVWAVSGTMTLLLVLLTWLTLRVAASWDRAIGRGQA
ncbi:lipopolysaccharide biosynthesis protein [Actinomyces mediterranea]|uniref:lipopolysaccharide biosynthesis protein n=1 Tax=Actinomyces mediterranea TaxID=1871028 RepID=UPI0009710E3F|nr:oligosaccharide flippase family protein [Actinomyces mediterranea]